MALKILPKKPEIIPQKSISDMIPESINSTIDTSPYRPYTFPKNLNFTEILNFDNSNFYDETEESRLLRYKNVCQFMSNNNLLIRNLQNASFLEKMEYLTNDVNLIHQIRPLEDKIHENFADKKRIIMCAAPKTGTTNWNIMGVALMRNVTIQKVANGMKNPKFNFNLMYKILNRYEYILQRKRYKGDWTMFF